MLLGLSKKRIISTLLIATTLPLVVVSCGGGGGGAPAGPSVSTQAAPTNPVSIDLASSRNVASSAFSNFSSLNTNPSLGSGSATNAPPVFGVSSSEISYKQLVTNVSRKFFKPTTSSVTGATIDCPNGGTATGPDWTPPGTFNGTLTFSANNCVDGTTTVNGSMVFSGKITFTGTANNYDATDINGTFTFNNLTMTDSNTASSIDGAITVVMNDSAGVSVFSINGSSLTFRDTIEVTELKNFVISFVSDINALTNTFDINFTVNSSIINGSITVATPTKFKISTALPPKDYPYEGQVIITGSNASKFRLTVDIPAVGGGVASDTVTIEIDKDGDVNGIYEIQKNYKWSDL